MFNNVFDHFGSFPPIGGAGGLGIPSVTLFLEVPQYLYNICLPLVPSTPFLVKTFHFSGPDQFPFSDFAQNQTVGFSSVAIIGSFEDFSGSAF